MTALLLPGRHHLLTNFQLAYLTRVLEGDPATLADVDGRPLDGLGRVDAVVWAVTSANHANTRRNPLPAHRREAAIEAFAAGLDAASFVYLIDDVGVMPRFAEYVLKKVAVDSRGRFRLTPANCVVGCSTPGVIELYERLGFRVLPFELADRARETYRAERPWELVEALAAAAAAGRDWRTDERFVTLVSRASRRLYLRYGYGDLVADLHRSPLLTDDGDLTATRDYNAYVRAFDEGAARKAALVRDHVRPGRIVDVGCCTGAVLRELTQEGRLRESDFYGIEVARPLYAECLHRKEQGAFANENVFFYHCDFAAGPVFPPDSVDTLTTFSLTHEIESYSGREALLRFVAAARDQLAPGGRWINVDVVGPEGGDEPVVLRLARGDGSEDDPLREFGPGRRDALRAHLEGLSTYARFLRFARDFRRAEGYALRFERFEAGPAGGADAAADDNDAAEGGGASDDGGWADVVLPLRDACEFLSKKDYADNWESEMHETFCFWSFPDWRRAAEAAGLRVLPASHAFANPWVVEHRYRGKVRLFRRRGPALEPLGFPPTTMLLVAEKV